MSRTHKKREREFPEYSSYEMEVNISILLLSFSLSLSIVSINTQCVWFIRVGIIVYLFFCSFPFSSFVHCNLWNTQRIKYPVEIMWYGIYVPGVYLSMSWTWSGGGLCLPCAPPSHHSVILSGDLWSSICINILFPWTHFYVLEYLNTLCTCVCCAALFRVRIFHLPCQSAEQERKNSDSSSLCVVCSVCSVSCFVLWQKHQQQIINFNCFAMINKYVQLIPVHSSAQHTHPTWLLCICVCMHVWNTQILQLKSYTELRRTAAEKNYYKKYKKVKQCREGISEKSRGD